MKRCSISCALAAITAIHSQMLPGNFVSSQSAPSHTSESQIRWTVYGLFSQNPPVRELLDAQPDELWVVQINPTARSSVPRSVLAIADRRNELAGNLSLYQELHFIEKIDQLLADGLLVDSSYKQVTVRVIEMSRPRSSRWLGPASKVNRDSRFLRRLIVQGERQADSFLTALACEQAADLWHRY